MISEMAIWCICDAFEHGLNSGYDHNPYVSAGNLKRAWDYGYSKRKKPKVTYAKPKVINYGGRSL